MDRETAHEATHVLATLIGEIMEDHVAMALSPPVGGNWPGALRRAGEDIATLAAAIAVITRRSEKADDSP